MPGSPAKKNGVYDDVTGLMDCRRALWHFEREWAIFSHSICDIMISSAEILFASRTS